MININNNMWIPRTNPQFVMSELSEVVDWGLKILGVPEFWKVTKGEGVTVAILDTGVDLNHPDLKNNIIDGCDFTGSGGFDDKNGHGTHCSGIVAAWDGNGTGVTGVAPAAKLVIAKVLGDNGCGDYSQIAKGIDWAADRAEILSMSMGSPLDSKELYDAIKRAYDKGKIIICAAGNDGDISNGSDINYPSVYPETISVGSIDENMNRSSFSSVGDRLDVVAPGGHVYSTYLNNSFAILSGTSMSTPYVSGLAALTLSFHKKNNSLTPIKNNDDMREHLKRTAIKKGDTRHYGAGIVDPESLLKET